MCVSVVTGGDAAEVFEPAEHALDGVSVAIEERGEAGLLFPVGFRRNVGERAAFSDLLAQSVCVIALVAVDYGAIRQAVEKSRGGCAIGDVPARDQKGERAAVFVRQRMNLGGSPATGTADRLIFLPPFPPAAER